jgi:hypothetical protein
MTYLGKKFGDRNTPATRLTRLARMGLVGRLRFGASDQVLGALESGVDIERRIAAV